MKDQFIHSIKSAFDELHIKYRKYTKGTNLVVFYMQAPENSKLHDTPYFMYSLRVDSATLSMTFMVINVFGTTGIGYLEKLHNAVENTNKKLDIGKFIVFDRDDAYQVNYINDLSHINMPDGFAFQLSNQFELFHSALGHLSSSLENEGFDFCLDI